MRRAEGSGGGGNPQPFCLSNCCRVFVITVKSKPHWAAGGLRAERPRNVEMERILNP